MSELPYGALAEKITKEFTPAWFLSSPFRSSDHTPIDTEDLFESCALLIEIIFLLFSYQGPDHTQELRKKRTAFGTDMLGGSASLGRIHGLTDEYIGPIKYAALLFEQPLMTYLRQDESEPSWDFFSENPPTLVAAIEVALNPPSLRNTS